LSIVTTSTNGEVKVWSVKRLQLMSVYHHTSAVLSFDWSGVLHVMAFCGGDRVVTLWNPYSKRKLNALEGHTSTVVCVTFDDAHHQMASLCRDLSIRIWDMRALRVVQRFHDESEVGVGKEWSPLCHVNPRNSALVTVVRGVSVWPLTRASTGIEATRRLKAPALTALYNRAFKQVGGGCATLTVGMIVALKFAAVSLRVRGGGRA
jgi:WD40 repeat protein